jgi:hypothetical protein
LERRELFAAGDLIKNDDFVRSDGTELGHHWVAAPGDFRVANEQLVSNEPKSSLAWVRDATAQDVRLEVDVRISNQGRSTAGLLARGMQKSHSELYLAQVDGNQGIFHAELWRFSSGSWINLARVRVDSGTGRLSLDAIGATFTVRYNGMQVAAITEPTMTSGRSIGLRAWGEATFDRFAAYEFRPAWTPEITHTVLPEGSSRFTWTTQPGVDAYHVVLTDQRNDAEVFRGWVYDRQLDLKLSLGNHQIRVAASGSPYGSLTFESRRPMVRPEGTGFLRLGLNDGIIHWSAVPNNRAYLLKIRNSSGKEIVNNYVYDTQYRFQAPADDYDVYVAAPSQRATYIPVNLSDFRDKDFVPLTPLGPTDRSEVSFSWFPVRGAANYFLQVKNNSNQIVTSHWTHGLSSQATLTPGEYSWRVIPLDENNTQADRSQWIPFTVTDNPLTRENILGVDPNMTVPARLAMFNYPQSTLRGRDGLLYILDTQSSVIRRVVDDQVEIFAGTLQAGYNGDGHRSQVMLNRPVDMLLDENGDLIVLDSFNFLIRKIELSSGMVSTIAGIPGQSAFPEPGSNAQTSPIGFASAITFDEAGNLWTSFRVHFEEGPLQKLMFISPQGIWQERPFPLLADRLRNVSDIHFHDDYFEYINGAHLIRQYSDGRVLHRELPSHFAGGIVYSPQRNKTLVGVHTVIYEFDENLEPKLFASGFANVVSLRIEDDRLIAVDGDRGVVLAFDLQGNPLPQFTVGNIAGGGVGTIVATTRYDDDTLLFVDNKKGYIYGYSISRGAVWVFAGNGSHDRAAIGVHRSETGFYYANGIAVDAQKNVFVSENHRIMKIDQQGMVSHFAGDVNSGDLPNRDSAAEVPAAQARFQSIRGLVFDHEGHLIVADTYNNKIRRISPQGMVRTIAGTGEDGRPTFGVAATSSRLNRPHSALPLQDGRLLIADSWNNTIVRVERDGTLTHVAGVPLIAPYQGNGDYTGDGGPATRATLDTPFGIAQADDGTLLVVDSFNNAIRAISPAGVISTVFGDGTQGFGNVGQFLNLPVSIQLVGRDAFVTDPGNGIVSRIRLNW